MFTLKRTMQQPSACHWVVVALLDDGNSKALKLIAFV
jgi:hypothetical protein